MILPETTDAVCAAVRKAAAEGTALVPRSSSGPHLHGGSDNPAAETICFEKMDRIVKISRHDRYARVEAGVTFGALLPALAAEGLPVLGGSLGEGFLRVQLPPDRLEEAMRLCHSLFLA